MEQLICEAVIMISLAIIFSILLIYNCLEYNYTFTFEVFHVEPMLILRDKNDS